MKLRWVFPTFLKWTLGVFLLIAISVVFVEWFNLTNHLLELMYESRTTMEQACKYFSKESYRGNDIEGNSSGVQFTNLYDICDAQGNVVVSGQFYEDKEEDTYNKLYDGNSCFDEYMNWLLPTLEEKGFDYANNNHFMFLKKVHEGEENYKKYFVTPLNLGFSYLDEETVTHIFTWFLVNKLSAIGIKNKDIHKRDLIRKENGRYYVRWYGLRLYIDNIKVHVEASERCKMLRLNVDEEFKELQDYTGITSLYREGGEDTSSVANNRKVLGNKIQSQDLRNYKVLYDVRWELDLAYEGLLPIGLLWDMMFKKNQVFELNDMVGYQGNLGHDKNSYGPINWEYAPRVDYSSVNKKSRQGNFQFGNIGRFGNTESLNANHPDDDKSFMYVDEDGQLEGLIGHLGSKKHNGIVGLAQRTKFVLIH